VSERDLVAELRVARERFIELVGDLRPELHRYCARMTGSIADGEDVVQDTLARAYYALSELDELPPLRPWLFRIAHNRAIDHNRRFDRRMRDPLDDDDALAGDAGPESDPEASLAQSEAMRAAVSLFLELAPAQRSCVILKDVLGHAIGEIAELLGLTEPAVKAALHRGRTRLRELRTVEVPTARAGSPEVARYAALFNARDWDAVRAMLADDVRLDLVTRAQRTGRRDVGNYCTNYDKVNDWYLVPAWLDGREVLAVYRAPGDPAPSYFIELTFVQGKLTYIHDFRYVPYITRDAAFTLA
jgi:RNA polymerase sigma-70 factor, ECF subfamily